jgi:hypothetical protein
MSAKITVKFMGGLGNSLFQWAYSRALQANGYEVEYDPSAYANNAHRQYWLEPLVGFLPFGDSSKREVYEGSHIFHPEALTPADGSKMIGYWQTEQYFANIAERLRNHVNLRWAQNPLTGYAKEIEEEIYKNQSVFLHVRRQDYVGLQHFHGLLPIEYYREALKLIRNMRCQDVKVFVFSDDQVWCSQHLPVDFHFVRCTNMWEDIRLMASCKDAILANSSFGWWGAWFGDNQLGRTVVAPKKWFTSPDVDDRDLVPSRWIRI